MQTFTKKSLWMNQSPSLNFEYGEDELLALAIERGFVTEIGKDLYQMNDKYETTNHPSKESA